MNRFGRLFTVEIMGESHGDIVGVVIDGMPAGVDIKLNDFNKDLSRRAAGQIGTTRRRETDRPKIITGIFNKKTTGAPITIVFENKNLKSSDYNFVKAHPRPGHADFVASRKFNNFNDYRGGGHFSGRLSLPIVGAGVFAKKIISPIKINAKLIEVGGSSDINSSIKKAMKENDSIGGIIECEARNIPIGLGEPFFDSLESLISHAMFSIPGIKGIEFGNGFSSSKLKGSQNNDLMIGKTGKTKTNNSGGINGGISNGNKIYFKVAVKPTSSIGLNQETFNFKSDRITKLNIKGRHDVCFALRVPPIVEALFSIVLADLLLINNKFKINGGI